MLDAPIYWKAERYKKSRAHATWIHNRIPPSKLTPGQTWLYARQQQDPDRKETDLTKLQPFVIKQRTHIKNARCPGKKISKEGKGVTLLTMMLIRGHYWHELFSQNGIIKGHDNSYIRYQTLNDGVESQTGNLPGSTFVRDPEEYKYLIGARHVDPDSGCT